MSSSALTGGRPRTSFSPATPIATFYWRSPALQRGACGRPFYFHRKPPSAVNRSAVFVDAGDLFAAG
ncbi:MAG: hypothetical protein KGI51_12320, partial [Rhodospirillales bacterium]|nr:hypothetical protein [Rhodospirillales bacterium]